LDPLKFSLIFTSVLFVSCSYNLRLQFHVQRDIVSGLKYINPVYRKTMGVKAKGALPRCVFSSVVLWITSVFLVPCVVAADGVNGVA